MTLRWKSAVELAERMSTESTLGFGVYEAYALQDHPDALEHMGEAGRGIKGSKQRGSASTALQGALVIPMLLLLIAPIVGFAAILGDPLGFHRMDASTSVPIAGVSFAVSAVLQVVMALQWWRNGRSRHALWLIYGFGTALLAGGTWITMANAAAFDGFGGWEVWRAPVLVAGVLGLAFGVLILALGQRPAPRPVDLEAQRSLRTAIDAIPGDERARILEDRNAAIAMMVEKGRWSPEIGERAMRAELGTLHLLDDELRTQRR